MSAARFVVGIDLGTTNTALSFIDGAQDPNAPASVFEIPQVAAPKSVLLRPLLPSFMYLASHQEFVEGALDLPWANNRSFCVGAFAKERGAEVPLRLVASAKSWLCHQRVDRRQPILPVGAPDEVAKVSPVAASASYLAHLKDAWNAAHPEHTLETQDIVLTVPASFDASARELTVDAAREAGLVHITLLEEPQAAFYAWIEAVGDAWRKRLRPHDRILVIDVGGGTSDFSLIEVQDDEGNLSLSRVAVGDHILLGGDNMDLALAYHLGERWKKDGKSLDAAQERSLVAAARTAKEKLLGHEAVEGAPVTVLGRGSKLIGNKLTTTLSRAEATELLVDGFFPNVAPDTALLRERRTGFLDLGLPYALDPAITRHLVQFLNRHAKEGRTPTHILFNGGVFNSPVLRRRVLDVLGALGAEPNVLEERDHELAVAKGAAYFGATKRGKGIRIRAGVGRTYYLGVEDARPAVPGVRPRISARCVVPFGTEEGTQLKVPGAVLGLVVGEPAEFRFLSSTTRNEDTLGISLDSSEWPSALIELAPLVATLEATDVAPGTVVPVALEVKVTEVGTVELWAVQVDGPGRWRLEFEVDRSSLGT